MRILVSKYWKNFRKNITTQDGKTKSVKDGKQFERLIKAILDLEYGKNHWIDTGETWDGSRDFEWRTPNYYRWAECKNYTAPISLNVISNTLVMAMVDFADEILIFSYSKIKKPVLRKLIQFADVSQKVLRIYADESLEEIILKHIEKLKEEFFPEYTETCLNNIFIEPYVSCNIISDSITAFTVNDDLGCIPHKPASIKFNSLLCLNICIFNPNAKEIALTIDVNWGKDEHCFKILNYKNEKKLHFQLNANTTIVKKIYFEVILYRPVLCFPNVLISSTDFRKEYTFGNVKCSWIGECALQGSSYKKIRLDFEMRIMNSNFFQAINIYGTSGTGKTRLLRECENIALGYGYRVVRFSLHNKCENPNTFQKMVMEFVCAIYDVPNMEEYVNEENSNNLSDVYRMISNIKNKQLQYEELIRIIIPIIANKLMNVKCYITFDNVQYYPRLFIKFVNELVEELMISNMHCRCRMGFSFNMDYVFHQTECADFYTFLISNKEKVQNEKIEGFSTTGETRVFLNQLLPTECIDELYINKIIEISQNKPFFIQLYFKTLETTGVLEKRQDCYVIPQHKYNKFIENTTYMPENIRDILKKRWASYLCAHNEQESVKIFAILHIFQYLNNEYIRLFSLSKSEINELHKFHFLERIEGLQLSYHFEHDLTEKFFSEEYFPLCEYAFDKTATISISTNFWYKKISDIIYMQDISINSLEEMIKKDVPYKLGLEIYNLLTNYLLERIDSNVTLEKYLQNICDICANVRELYGTGESISLYKKLVEKVESAFPEYQSNEYWAWAMITYGNLLYESNCYEDAIKCIIDILPYWPENNIHSRNTTIYCYLYNRLHVYKRALNRKINENSLMWLEKSEALQDSAEVIFLNLIDRGYCKYDCISSKEEIVNFWRQACNIYETNSLASKKLNYYYAKIRINLFNNNLKEAKSSIQEGLRIIEQKEEGTYYFTYFKQRYLLCKIALYLLDYQESNKGDIIDMFYDVDDINYILKGRMAYSIFCLKSIFYFATHQYWDSFLCIQSAIDTLFENGKLTFRDIYINQIYENAEYFMAQYLISCNPAIDLEQLENQHLVARLKKVINMSSEECLHYIDIHKATGLLQTPDYKINFPVL